MTRTELVLVLFTLALAGGVRADRLGEVGDGRDQETNVGP